MNRGALIVLEGCDRVGKTTQAKLLVKRICESGVNAQFMNFPNRSTPCGQLIDGYLRKERHFSDEEIHLLFTLNRWEAKKNMESLLMAGTTLVIDRYSYSGVAYSAAKGLDISWCKSPEAGLLKPDLVLFLALNEIASKQRNGYGDERYETTTFQADVRNTFRQLEEPNLWKTIDADKSEALLNEELLEHIKTTMAKVKNSKLQTLW